MSLSLLDLLGDSVLAARQNREIENVAAVPHKRKDHLVSSIGNKNKVAENPPDKELNRKLNEECSDDAQLLTDEDSERRKVCSTVEIESDEYSLVTKDGVVLDIVSVSELIDHDVVIGLYFTSSTLQECRPFTEELLALHSRLGGKLKLVVVAGDETCYRQCLATTPFYCVPYHYCHIRRTLCRRYRITSLTSLVLLDSRTARLLSRPDLETLQADPEALKFPWRPRALKELLKSVELVNSDGQKLDYTTIRHGYKALYFSAHWCPPCKVFTPQLQETYHRIRENDHDFEVIFVSSDRSEESYVSYRSAMPWASVAWAADRRELAAALQVEDIPRLVLLGPDDCPLTHQGRNHVIRDPQGQEFPWSDQSVEILHDRHMATLQERPCFIIFADSEEQNVSGEQDVYLEQLLPVAEEYLLHRVPPDGTSVAFFVALDSDLSESLRDGCGLEDVTPLVCIIDLAEESKYVMDDDRGVTTAYLHTFLTRYNRQELTSVPLTPRYLEDKET